MDWPQKGAKSAKLSTTDWEHDAGRIGREEARRREFLGKPCGFEIFVPFGGKKCLGRTKGLAV
jgi:hypothetical protein